MFLLLIFNPVSDFTMAEKNNTNKLCWFLFGDLGGDIGGCGEYCAALHASKY